MVKAVAEVTQADLVLKHIKTHGSITALDAFRHYNITRLAARVFELKQAGHNIESTLEKHDRCNYSRYFLRAKTNEVNNAAH